MANSQFSITIPDLNKFEKAYAEAPTKVVKILGDAIKQATIGVQSIARSESPVRTGKLRAAIGFKTDGLEGIIYPDLRKVPYARYVHSGTGLYGPNRRLITPKRSSVLATKINPGWGSAGHGGYYIIGKSSKGQHANPFMERAYKTGRVAVKRIFNEAGKKLVAELRVNG